MASDPDRVTRTEEPGNWEIFAILGVTLVLVFVFLTLQAGVIPVSVIYLFDLLLLTNIALGDARKRIIPNRVVIPATVAVVEKSYIRSNLFLSHKCHHLGFLYDKLELVRIL